MTKRQYIYPRSAADPIEGAEPNISEMGALDNLLSGEAVTPEPIVDPVPEDAVVEPVTPTPLDKQGNAFAQMRIQNKSYKDLLSKVAQATGIEFSNEEDLIAKLNGDALDKLAKQQNVPVELLQRMEQLEEGNKNWEEQQLKNNALIGFQNLQTTYGLTNEELEAFAAELDVAEKNPFQMQVDLLSEYKLTHFEEITQKMVTAAVQAALSKNSVADTQSSTPGNAQGVADGGSGQPISTVSALNAFLKDA